MTNNRFHRSRAFLRFAGRLLFPPRCAACRELLPIDDSRALCPTCSDKWMLSQMFRCPVCAQYEKDCRCHPPRTVRGVLAYLHVASYHDSVVHAVVNSLKHYRQRDTFSFCAQQMSGVLQAYLAANSHCRRGLVATTVPASKRIRLTGFDPSQELLRIISKSMGIPQVRALMRHDGKQQKGMSRAKRLENAKKCYGLRQRHGDFSGKTVVLIDDVLTTGASTAVCAGLLMQAGASGVIVLTFAKTHEKAPAHRADNKKQ